MDSTQKTSQNEKRRLLNTKSITDTVVDADVPVGVLNEDPVTGASGCHPVGTGMGAAIGAAGIGAAAGTVAGPIGTVVGAIVGGIAGGLVGKGAAEFVNPTVELAYWEEHYDTRPYHREGKLFDYYRPAYQIGWESFDGNRNRTWEQREPVIKKKWEDISRWESEGGAPKMTWEEAKLAAKDAHDRLVGLHDATDESPKTRAQHPR